MGKNRITAADSKSQESLPWETHYRGDLVAVSTSGVYRLKKNKMRHTVKILLKDLHFIKSQKRHSKSQVPSSFNNSSLCVWQSVKDETITSQTWFQPGNPIIQLSPCPPRNLPGQSGARTQLHHPIVQDGTCLLPTLNMNPLSEGGIRSAQSPVISQKSSAAEF